MANEYDDSDKNVELRPPHLAPLGGWYRYVSSSDEQEPSKLLLLWLYLLLTTFTKYIVSHTSHKGKRVSLGQVILKGARLLKSFLLRE